MKKLLVCVNNKPHSEHALNYACVQAGNLKADIDIIYIIEPVKCTALFSVSDKIQEETESGAEKILDNLAQNAIKPRDIKISKIIKIGTPTDMIIETIGSDTNYIMLFLGVAEDSYSGGFISHIVDKMGDEITIPLVIIPRNSSDFQI